MTVWCHLPTIFSRRIALRIAGLVALCVALITTLIFAAPSMAVQSTNKVVNFQGRLLTSSGSVVPDGYYNMQFKIYQGGAGTAAGNPGGSLEWTETYVNNNANSGIMVRNGMFSVSLGSSNQFGSSVDWNQDTLWLSMNVAGSAAACTTFGTAPCAADGEMLPMKRITAVPNAINSEAVGGKTADNLVQLAQGVQTDASTNTSSIFINKTGTGNLVQLQNTATDVFTITNTGSITLGNNANKSLSITTSGADTNGRELSVVAGGGGSGTGTSGGDLVLQGGAAGGTDGNGGSIQIDAGAKTGTGNSGSIAIGSTNAGTITIGSTSVATAQTINIGTNNTAGSSADVTVGAGGSATSGSTTIQAKNAVTIKTDGTTRATFSETTNTVYFGNGVAAAAPNDYTIQGTNSSATAVAGGSLTVQGGNATTGDANGGNIILTGGTGSGTGANGLVVLSTPTFSTVNNDANCYTSGAVVASSCTITTDSVDGSSGIIIGFSATGQTATLPDPTITTAGRVIYIMAAGNSEEFTLSMNASGSQVIMQPNTANTAIWNGSDWLLAGGASSASLQDAYNNTPQSAGGTELVLNNLSNANGLTIRDGGSGTINDTVLEVQNSGAGNLFSVNNRVGYNTEFAADGTVDDAENFSSNWLTAVEASISLETNDGQAGDSVEVNAGTGALNGVRNILAANPETESRYRLSVYVKLTAGSEFSDFTIAYSPNGTDVVFCTDYNTQTVPTGVWTQITCIIETDNATVTSPYLILGQPTEPAEGRTFLVDTLSMKDELVSTQNITVGNGSGAEDITLFTLDKSAGAPEVAANETLVGSMYYDTTLGKVQCYEAEGWGPCGASPDNFITISPEYTNAVMHGNGIGTMSSDFCSDTLNINDGSSSQPTICGTNETYNFYKWTSPEITAQDRSIFVTYQLPTSFKEFVATSTSLMGRTDSSDASVTYYVYRNDSAGGLTACGSAVTVSTGAQSTWQKATASGGADPAACGFSAGDSIVFRIDLSTANDANAYLSNLGFTFSNY